MAGLLSLVSMILQRIGGAQGGGGQGGGGAGGAGQANTLSQIGDLVGKIDQARGGGQGGMMGGPSQPSMGGGGGFLGGGQRMMDFMRQLEELRRRGGLMTS